MILCYIIGGLILGGFIVSLLFSYEIRHAITILDTEPFLKGDYAEEEPYVKYHNVYCKNCKFFDGTATCLHEHSFGILSNHNTIICKTDGFFEPK